MLNFDYPSATISHSIADAIIKYIQERNLQVEWHIETHVHADHLSAGPYLQKYLGGKLAIGEYIVTGCWWWCLMMPLCDIMMLWGVV